MRFRQFLNEVATPVEVEWNPIRDDQRIVSFAVPFADGSLDIDFSKQGALTIHDPDYPNDRWEVSFNFIDNNNKKKSRQSPFTMLKKNDGREFSVFSTVAGYVKEFLDRKKPDLLTFSADKDEANRISVYKRMLNKNQKNLNDVGYYVNDKKDENLYDKYGIEVFDIVNSKFKQGMTEEE
jgi:hypothetical protein